MDASNPPKVNRDQFQSAELKIEWAKQHIHNLHTAFEGFQREGNHRFFLEPNAETGQTDLILHADPLPVIILLLLGDAVHNLSSALDHAWNVLARASRDSRDKLTFPVNESWDHLVATLEKTPIKSSFPEVGRVILDEIAPAKDRKGHNLWAIRQLDNLDKHNLIIPAVQVTGVRDFLAQDDQGSLFAGGSVEVHGNGAHMTVASFQGKAELYGNTKPSIDIAFSKDQFIIDQPILPALRQTVQAVSEAVFLLKERFSG